MKRLVLVLALPFLFTTGTAFAESPMAGGVGLSPSDTSYEQALRHYKDPNSIVRAKAQFRSEQRMRRMESMRWFGLSNSRPQASSDPFDSDYSPKWVSNSGYYPSRWNGISQQ